MKIAAALLLAIVGITQVSAQTLSQVIDGEHRSDANVARDQYRHPLDTLNFFDIAADMRVVEVWPGTYYTEILAPYLQAEGEYYAAGFSLWAQRTPTWRRNVQRQYVTFLDQDRDLYGDVRVTGMSIPEHTNIAPASSADRVLTFRNVHNWMNGEYEQQAFETLFEALKPGGILGVVEHRAAPGTSKADMRRSGYVTEAYVKELAKHAGFEFVAASEINANPKDSKNHPFGVWTLPPRLRAGEMDRAKYLAIGESDRMTLKFRKPQ